jgi:hypothetical protein
MLSLNHRATYSKVESMGVDCSFIATKDLKSRYPAPDSKAFAGSTLELDKLLDDTDVEPISSFIPITEHDVACAKDLGVEMRASPVCEFDPAEGLKTIRALIKALKGHARISGNKKAVMAYLQYLKTRLEAARKHKAKFHLVIM